VDRLDSRNLLASTAVVWSSATVFTAAAGSFGEVLGARMISGIGQAFSNPASYTILSRVYPEERRATVNGLYSSGVYFGGGLAALSVLLLEPLGWRNLFILVGGLGLATAVIVQATLPPLPPVAPMAGRARDIDVPLLDNEAAVTRSASTGISEDASEGSSVDEQSASDAGTASMLDTVRTLLSERTVALLLLASTLRFLAGFTIGVWIVPFYREAFPGQIGAQFALTKAAVNGFAGSASATGGGLLADNLAQRDARYQLWVPAAGTMLAIPLWLATLGAPTIELSLAALFLEYLLAECWLGPTVASLQAAAPPSAQGLTTGVFSCLTLVGNLAPFLIGIAVQSGGYQLPELLAYSVPALYALASLAFIAAADSRERV